MSESEAKRDADVSRVVSRTGSNEASPEMANSVAFVSGTDSGAVTDAEATSVKVSVGSGELPCSTSSIAVSAGSVGLVSRRTVESVFSKFAVPISSCSVESVWEVTTVPPPSAFSTSTSKGSVWLVSMRTRDPSVAIFSWTTSNEAMAVDMMLRACAVITKEVWYGVNVVQRGHNVCGKSRKPDLKSETDALVQDVEGQKRDWDRDDL